MTATAPAAAEQRGRTLPSVALALPLTIAAAAALFALVGRPALGLREVWSRGDQRSIPGEPAIDRTT